MKIVKSFLFFCISIILISCDNERPRAYFNAPNIDGAIVNECTGFRNGEEVDVTNFIAVDPDEYSILQDYYEDKERRLYFCLKYRRRCR